MNTVTLPALALCLGAAIFAPLAQAADVTPGLWEFTSRKLSVGGSPDLSAHIGMMRDQIRLLPPETRAMIEQQMRQRGISMGADGRVRSCITAEQADRNQLFSGRVEGNCSFSEVRKEADRLRGRVHCTQPQGSGDFDIRIHDPKHFSTVVRLNSPQGEVHTETDARWLGAQCAAPDAAPG